MNTEQRIAYSVAFKGVIDLVAAGSVAFETTDIVAETIELTDAFYEAIGARTGLGSDVAVPSTPAATSTPSPSRFSTPAASAPSGSTSKGPKDPNAAASPAQVGFLKKLIGEKNVPSDANGFELEGVVYEFAAFTMGSIQVPIEALKG